MSPPGRPVVVWWVKRDARLHDNAPLAEAARLGAAVLPLLCVEPSLAAASDTSDMHLQAQWQAVGHLRDQLRRRGADILIAHGEVTDKLAKLRALVPVTHVFAHEEVGNAVTFRRDVAVADWCRANGVTYQEFPQSSVRRGGVDRDRRHELWQTRVAGTEPLPVPELWQPADLTRLAAGTAFPKLPAFADRPGWQPVTEAAGHATLADFLDRRGRWYRGGISSPTRAATAGSRLSVHLAWGTLTARQVWHATRRRIDALDPAEPDGMRWRASLEGFLSRLHWRDHFTQRLESEPEMEFRSIHPCYRDLHFEDDPGLYAAWRTGRTGFPLVDAVMRCLAATGFVNFRMRAMVTSVACHALHLDWRLIHPHLAGVFRDYDPGIHLAPTPDAGRGGRLGGGAGVQPGQATGRLGRRRAVRASVGAGAAAADRRAARGRRAAPRLPAAGGAVRRADAVDDGRAVRRPQDGGGEGGHAGGVPPARLPPAGTPAQAAGHAAGQPAAGAVRPGGVTPPATAWLPGSGSRDATRRPPGHSARPPGRRW